VGDSMNFRETPCKIGRLPVKSGDSLYNRESWNVRLMVNIKHGFFQFTIWEIYNNSSSANDLYLPPGKHKQIYTNTFGYSSVKIWNTLSSNIRESVSLNDFKRKFLTNYFLTSN
jgi:hypothetical protein